MTIVDLYDGPGGWLHGLHLLNRPDLPPAIGLELDDDAIATSRAAGHHVTRADVTRTDPADVATTIHGLIASPPCPAFSAAGNGHGRALITDIVAAIHDHRFDAFAGVCDVHPTVDVGRWITTTEPSWIVMEQVPAVLPIWQAYAHLLHDCGYSTWCGILSAERYGVPQTRRRAFLLASRSRTVEPPAPTHQRYEPGVAQGDPEACGGLFDHVKPWISVFDAIGIPGTITTGQNSAHAGGTTKPYKRSTAAPGPTLTGQARSWVLGFPRRADAAETITGGGTRTGGAEPFRTREGLIHTNRNQSADGTRQTRPVTKPAPTFTGKSGGQWHFRPATTVLGDPRLWPPGHKVNADDQRRHPDADERYGDRAGTDAIRLTIPEALILQGFPPDYPVHGTKTSQFRQIGNAVPPPLAAAVLGQLLGSAT